MEKLVVQMGKPNEHEDGLEVFCFFFFQLVVIVLKWVKLRVLSVIDYDMWSSVWLWYNVTWDD